MLMYLRLILMFLSSLIEFRIFAFQTLLFAHRVERSGTTKKKKKKDLVLRN